MASTSVLDLEPREKLERFCFIGNFKPTFYRRRESLDVKKFYSQLEEIVIGLSGKIFTNVIKKCASYDGIRKDEIFLSIYVFMFCEKIPPCDRLFVRECFPEVIANGKELLLYVKYIKECSTFKQRHLYSKYNKKLLQHWYKSQSSNTLSELFSAKKTYYGFCHYDVFKIFHIPNDILDNPLIAQFLFKPNPAVEDAKKVKKIQTIQRIFNESTEDAEVLSLMKIHKISFDNIPKNMLKKEAIWIGTLDGLQPQDLLRLVSNLILEKFFMNKQNRKLLKPTYDKCLEKIKEMFVENEGRAVDQKINLHPSNLLFILKTLTAMIANTDNVSVKKKKKKVTKAAAATEDKTPKEPEARKEIKFPDENEEIVGIIETACKNYKGDGLRICSTIQLSYLYHAEMIRTSDFKVMEYLAAYSLVYPYTRCAKTNTCFMFGKMESLKPLTFKGNFESEKESLRKMYQAWTEKGDSKCHLPIKEAFRAKKTYDLFITVVRYTSLCTKLEPLTSCFKKYRSQKNPKAKMVIVNMRKKNPGIVFEESKNEGILELCHFDADTPNIIRAFALNYFN